MPIFASISSTKYRHLFYDNVNNLLSPSVMENSSHNKQDVSELCLLIQQYEKRLVQFAFSYIGNVEVAKEYVLESFTDYWMNRHLLEKETNAAAFILTILRFKCLNHLRSKHTQKVYFNKIHESEKWELDLQINSLQACDPKELFTSEIYRIMEDTLDKLPSSTKQIFHLSRFENKSRKEIASIMKMSIKGVEYHIRKALTALRKNLKDYTICFF